MIIMGKCGRCQKDLEFLGNEVCWNPITKLCDSCQKEWTTLFFDSKLDYLNKGQEEFINKVWQGFLKYNPSSRISH